MLRVIRVESGSPAQATGIRAGDQIIRINGRAVRDYIDFHYHAADPFLRISLLSAAASGKRRLISLEREPERSLGLQVEEPPIQRCRNRCVFCFIDQLPRGLRRSLYIKDEDYRHGFLRGNFITGSNLSRGDVSRIIRMGLGPLYISVHAIAPEVRRRLLGGCAQAEILPLLERLTRGGVGVHGQVVLCPGINDGPVLEETIREFERLGPAALSLAVVPVGLSAHRGRLTPLVPVGAAKAVEVLGALRRWQRICRAKRGSRFVFAADEFYLLAGEKIPSGRSYEGYPQIENGVGLTRRSIDSLDRLLKRGGPLPSKPGLTCRIATGRLYAGVLASRLLPRLKGRVPGKVELSVVRNSLLGESITVAGLLPGRDILEELKRAPKADYYLVPSSAVNADGLFLDDFPLAGLREALAPGVVIAAEDLAGSLKKVAELESAGPAGPVI